MQNKRERSLSLGRSEPKEMKEMKPFMFSTQFDFSESLLKPRINIEQCLKEEGE
jgi:hypothetical protein